MNGRAIRRIGFGLAVAVAAMGAPIIAHAAGGGTVQGHLTGHGFAPDEIWVDLNYGTQSVQVSPTGDYSFADVEPGTYSVHIRNEIQFTTGSTQDFAGQVTVSAGTTTTFDISYNTLQGTITGGGAPIEAYVTSEALASPDEEVEEDFTTDVDGHFRMLVVADSYQHRIWFYPSGGDWLQEYYDNAYNEDDATLVRYDTGATLDIDVDLAAPATLIGHVGLPKGATYVDRSVVVYDAQGHVSATWTARGGKHRGDFTLTGLAPGTYSLGFGRASGYALTAGSYFRSLPENESASGAKVFTVSEGEVRTLKDSVTSASEAGTLRGTIYKVKAGKKHVRSDLRVVAVPVGGAAIITKWDRRSTRNDTTNKNGLFVIHGLSPGETRLFVWNSSYPFPGEKGYEQKKLGVWKVKQDKVIDVGMQRFEVKANN